MKKSNIIGLLIFTVMILLTTMISGCNNAEKVIICKWKEDNDIGTNMTFDFKPNNEVDVFMSYIGADGSGNPEELIGSGKYTIIGNKIELTLSGNPEATCFTPIPDGEKGTFEYKIKGDTLILSPDGIEERIFKKVN